MSFVSVSATITFALMIAFAYIGFAFAAKTTGDVKMELGYAFTMFINPFFVIAIILSVGSMFMRSVMIQNLGVLRTVIASELSVILMIGLSWLFFHEPIGIKTVLGTMLVIAGVSLVLSE